VSVLSLVAAVLGHAAEAAGEMFNNTLPSKTVLTFPARWEKDRKDIFAEAAEVAGLTKVRYVREPVAAAGALTERGALDGVVAGSVVLVYDFGAGTFDTTLLRRHKRGFQTFGIPGGDAMLGGDDIDGAVFDYLWARLPPADTDAATGGEDQAEWERARRLLRWRARDAKERLAREPEATVQLPQPFRTRELFLTSEDLAELSHSAVRKTVDLVASTIADNGVDAADLAAICLVGGSSRLLAVQRMLGEQFRCTIAKHGDPKALAACGALTPVRSLQELPRKKARSETGAGRGGRRQSVMSKDVAPAIQVRAANGWVWVVQADGRILTKLDAETGRTVGHVTVKGELLRVEAHAETLYLVSRRMLGFVVESMTADSTKQSSVASIGRPQLDGGVTISTAMDGSDFWITLPHLDRVSCVRTATGKVEPFSVSKPLGVGCGAFDGTWVAQPRIGRITKVLALRDASERPIELGPIVAVPDNLVVLGRYAVVACPHHVCVVDLPIGAVRRVNLGVQRAKPWLVLRESAATVVIVSGDGQLWRLTPASKTQPKAFSQVAARPISGAVQGGDIWVLSRPHRDVLCRVKAR